MPKIWPAETLLFEPPADLIEADQWVLWRRENDTKVPYQPSGKKASSTDLKTWRPYVEVYEAWRKYPQHWSGIGFVFSQHDPFCGIDLDNALQGGVPKSWARGIVERFADTYMEISPSGNGLHIFCRAKLPAAIGKVKVADGGVEIYDRARYFTITGKNFSNGPNGIEGHQTDVDTLYKSFHGGINMPKYSVPPDGKIPHGVQHLTLVSIAGTLRRRGVCESAIENCLQTINRDQCEQPGPPANISKIVQSSRRWHR